MSVLRLPVSTLPQPDETTCGPTCLHALYRYWGDDEPLERVIARSHRLEAGGTFAVFLGCDALRKGYRATLHTGNLLVFDPTWFADPAIDLAERLRRQFEAKPDPRLRGATEGYLEFLALGGRLRLARLSPSFVERVLRRGIPLLTGASSTFLYRTSRELADGTRDDIRGFPVGHFVVLAGYDAERRRVLVVDPYQPNPWRPAYEYWIAVDRAIAAVLLGVVTHDANLLAIYPARDCATGIP